MENELILRQFCQNNPFASSASPLPWNNQNPDLAALNREAEEEIEQLLREKRRAPFSPLAGLILGEAGAGKTHMLMRLLRRLKRDGQIAAFVTVRAFRDPETVMQRLLAETITSLGREHSAGRTQLDVLMGELDAAHREWLDGEGLSPREGLEGQLKTLRRQMPDFDNKGLLRCLLLYAVSKDPEARQDLLEWIRGGADEEEAGKLGLPARDLESRTKAEREEDAERTLLSLGQILACARVPMMVCFDQLDGMDSKELVNAWGRALSLLLNDLPGALPLAFLRADTWNNRFKACLDESVVQRLTPHAIIMRNCTLEQAAQLIRERVAAAFPDGWEERTRWLLSRLEGKLRSGYSPRMVIELAGHVIANEKANETAKENPKARPVPLREPVDQTLPALDAAWREERDKAAANPQDWPPDEESLLLALRTWLDARDDFSVSLAQDRHIRLKGQWTAGERPVPCAFIVIVPRAHGSASAALRQGIGFLKGHPGGLCCYVTDGRAHKGPNNWKVVAQNVAEFQGLKGKVLILDAEGRAEWYGLAAFINKLDNGDISVFEGGERRGANREDLKRYLKARPSLLFPHAQEEVPPLDDGRTAELLDSLLGRSPMKLLSMEKTLATLESKGVRLSREQLLRCAKSLPGRFRLFTSENDTLIQRVGR
ncbi:MAG: hypothetical protein IJU98_05695 [Synergistaceae bacterium]|nr:hypothetical protein [Synergistaceae bacterium]